METTNTSNLIEITPFENIYNQPISEFMREFRSLKAAYYNIVEPKGLYERTAEDGVIQHDYERKQLFVDTLAKAQMYNFLRCEIKTDDNKYQFCHTIKPADMPELFLKTTNNGNLEFVKEIQELSSATPSHLIPNLVKVTAMNLGVFEAAYEKGEGKIHKADRIGKDLPEKFNFNYEFTIGEITGAISFFNANTKRAEKLDLYDEEFVAKLVKAPNPELKCIAEVKTEYADLCVDRKMQEFMELYGYERENEQEKVNDEVEIVESNDGYVMNMTERTSANSYKIDNQVKETAGSKEVVHNEAPKETTTDMAKVGGNTKLETVSLEGTKDVVEKDIREDKEAHKEEIKEEKKKKNFFKRLFDRD